MYISKRVMFRGLSASESSRFDDIFQNDSTAKRVTIGVTALSALLVLALILPAII